jgi:hypothetical protein
VSEKIAQNEAIGNFTNTGIGLGIMGGLAGGMRSMVAGITTDTIGSISPQQGVPGNGMISPVIGLNTNSTANEIKKETEPPTSSQSSSIASDDLRAFKQKLEKLKLMKESGLLSDEEFEIE